MKPVPLKCGQLATKYPCIYEYFYIIVRRNARPTVATQDKKRRH